MNNHLQEIINKIIKSYDSIVQKSIKILVSHHNDQAIVAAICVVDGAALSIKSRTKITVAPDNEKTLFSTLRFKQIITKSYSGNTPIISEEPEIDLNYAAQFLDNIDKALDNFDNLLEIKDKIDKIFTDLKYEKIWLNRS